ncbi:Rossmann-like and DUF2520 domain-containing protein [Flavobacterium sp. LB2R40]|uniref:Rossmann-like and DUF2520 domain-containing protein n=1 Tax=unclassified Flavobacterium TaxID=196869 RepID=UPI003AABFAAD
MIKVVIIGSGNVAQHLIVAFQNSPSLGTDIELVQVYSRHVGSVSHLLDSGNITNDLNTLAEADVYIIAVSDDAIAEISSKLPFKNRLVVHTSGSVALNALDENNRKGVFYPLQSFTKKKEIDFKTIPICLESENATDYQLLDKVAKTIAEKVFAINSEQRKAIHVAAVFVNNFTNHMYQIAQEICQENQVPFEILKPLIAETATKIMILSPEEAQTGPAKRNDTATIQAHEGFLSKENHLNIYKILTQSIQENGKKL